MTYSLFIHPEAERDAEEIASYIGGRSFEGMLRWLDAYETAQARIQSNPTLSSPAAEEPILRRGLRQVLFKTPAGNRYRLVFVFDKTTITILRVQGQGQSPLTGNDLPQR